MISILIVAIFATFIDAFLGLTSFLGFHLYFSTQISRLCLIALADCNDFFDDFFLSNQDGSDDTGHNGFTGQDPSACYSLVYILILWDLVW